MFTSRAEFRTILRQDNADIRLTPIGYNLGLASEERYQKVLEKVKGTEEIISYFRETSVSPDEVNPLLNALETEPIRQKIKMINLVSRPQLGISELQANLPKLKDKLSVYDAVTIEQSEILMKYQGYIDKEQEMVDKMNKLNRFPTKHDKNYHKLSLLLLVRLVV